MNPKIPTELTAEQIASPAALEAAKWSLTGILPRGHADAQIDLLADVAHGKVITKTASEFLKKERELLALIEEHEQNREDALAAQQRAEVLRRRVTELETQIAHERAAVAEIEAALAPDSLAAFYFGRRAAVPNFNNEARVEIGRWAAGGREIVALIISHVIPRLEKDLAEARAELADFIAAEYPTAKKAARGEKQAAA